MLSLVNFREIPFVRLLIPFITGIALGIAFPVALNLKIFLILIGLAVLLLVHLSFRYTLLEGLCTLMAFFFLMFIGFFGVVNRHQSYLKASTSISNELCIYQFKVSSIPVVKPKSVKVEVEILSKCHGNKWVHFNNINGLIYFSPKFKVPNPGTIITVKCRFTDIPLPDNPYQFNLRQYLYYQGITKMAFVFKEKDLYMHRNKPSWSLLLFSSNCQKYLKGVFDRTLNDSVVKSTVESLVFGYKDEIPDQLTRGYARTGTLHVLAVSGMHVALVFLMLSRMLGFITGFKYSNLLKLTIILMAIWAYCFITGLSPSVLRAGFMITVILVGKVINRHANPFNILSLTAFVILVYNPFWLVNVGFQLSFTAVLGILLLNSAISNIFISSHLVINACWQILSVTISAQVFTFPISMYYFNQFPVYFLPANLIVIPLTTLIIYSAVVLLMVNGIPVLCGLISWFTILMVRCTNWIVVTIDNLPGSIIDGINLNHWQLLLIFCAVVSILVCFVLRVKMAFYFGVMNIMLVLLIGAINQWFIVNQRYFVRFNVPKANVFLITNGRSATLFTDTLKLSQCEYFVKGWMVRNYVWPPIEVVNLKSLNKVTVETPPRGYWFYKNNVLGCNGFRITNNLYNYRKLKNLYQNGSFERIINTENSDNLHQIAPDIVYKSHNYKILLSYYHRNVNKRIYYNRFKCLKIN